MKLFKLLAISLLVLISFTFPACEADDSIGGNTITITHSGIDWSTLQTGDETTYDQIDGETIGWCEPGQRIDGMEAIWYRTFNDNIYRLGNVDLASVTQVNTSQWSSDVCATPLANGDVWVAQCRDGYVKFKVVDQGSYNSDWWEVVVEYQFSTTTTFQ